MILIIFFFTVFNVHIQQIHTTDVIKGFLHFLPSWVRAHEFFWPKSFEDVVSVAAARLLRVGRSKKNSCLELGPRQDTEATRPAMPASPNVYPNRA